MYNNGMSGLQQEINAVKKIKSSAFSNFYLQMVKPICTYLNNAKIILFPSSV